MDIPDIPAKLVKNKCGFRISWTDKGKENDIHETFLDLTTYKHYPNPDPSKKPKRGDFCDNMFAVSSQQVLELEEAAK